MTASESLKYSRTSGASRTEIAVGGHGVRALGGADGLQAVDDNTGLLSSWYMAGFEILFNPLL